MRRRLLGYLPFILTRRAEAAAAVQIYAAMTFRPALERVLMAYRNAGGSATGVYAPTPVLVRQLAAGAPADIVLTADPDWMDQAVRQALVQPETRFNLLANDLVLAGPVGVQPVETITEHFPMEAFLDGGRLAMCDPVNDPAGRYARQSLQALGFWDAVSPHIAVAESAPAAVALVNAGEVRAAMCFKTDLYEDHRAIVVGTFPSSSHKPIVYPVALAKQPRSGQASEALTFLRSADTLRIFYDLGYRSADA